MYEFDLSTWGSLNFWSWKNCMSPQELLQSLQTSQAVSSTHSKRIRFTSFHHTFPWSCNDFPTHDHLLPAFPSAKDVVYLWLIPGPDPFSFIHIHLYQQCALGGSASAEIAAFLMWEMEVSGWFSSPKSSIFLGEDFSSYIRYISHMSRGGTTGSFRSFGAGCVQNFRLIGA